MKLEPPVNSNYCATVVKVKSITPLDNCDNVVSTTIQGFKVIVSKETRVGDTGIFFPPETQLSDVYCKVNNLYRHADMNLDKGETGYIENSRRIRAIKFRGNTSQGLFMPMTSLLYFGPYDFNEGDEFDQLSGMEVCRKYVVFTPGHRTAQNNTKKDSRVDQIHMPEHITTDQFYKVSEQFPKETKVTVTQKLHGTSIRIGHTYVARKLTIRDRVARFFGAKIQTLEHDYVFGSRKVIKDANNPDQMHYYESDVWSAEGAKLVGMLPENYLVYAELIGTLPGGRPIQSGYTYGFTVPKLFVYRIATINERGQTTDLSWDQVKEFCDKNGLKHVPELWSGTLAEFEVVDFMDKTYAKEYPQAIVLDDNGTVDEGVVIRVEGITPYVMKAKSPLFYEWETKLLDKGEEDVESSQS